MENNNWTGQEMELAKEIWKASGDVSVHPDTPVWCLHTARHLIKIGYGIAPTAGG